MKKPSFQFYPQDWRSDPGLRTCSLEERGFWIELLCIMHDSPRRGVLLLPNGEPLQPDDIARLIGVHRKTSDRLIAELLRRGVASQEESNGAIFSRRMVRDEHISQVRRDSGSLGGNPNLVNQTPSKPEAKPEQTSKQNPTPSSSPSPSASTSEGNKGTSSRPPEGSPTKYTLPEGAFESIWTRYPVKDGKADAAKAFARTVKSESDLTDINRALDSYLEHIAATPWKNYKNGKTWFRNWREWIDWKEPSKPRELTQEEKLAQLKSKYEQEFNRA